MDKDKLQEIIQQFEELTERLCDPELLADPDRYRTAAQQRSSMEVLAARSREYLELSTQKEETLAELNGPIDSEMQSLFKDELNQLNARLDELEPELKRLLLPKDPYAGKNVIVEIRPAAGGDEAGIFTGDLFRMYCKYAEKLGWKYQVLDAQALDLGGFKEVVFEIQGFEVYSNMKYESGVHRVQRVPETEAAGRIHTSTVTVAVLPEADEINETPISEKDLKVDTYRAQGAGGQHVNKTESAIRITHLPTGIIVACQEERSQHQNRDKAMRVLRAKLLEADRLKAEQEMSDTRRTQVGTGDRSEKIRTYNYPQSRVTDHRIGFSVMNLASVMEGDLDSIIQALQVEEQQKLLEASTAGN